MPKNEEPKWEVVDEIPGEKRTQKKSGPPSKSLLKSKSLWIGVAVGVLSIIFLPAVLVIVRRLALAWWIWLPLLAYWWWRKFIQKPS